MPRNRLLNTLLATAILSTTTAATAAPCFVAGDALGVELHCVAVMALATPEVDPMHMDTPTVLAHVDHTPAAVENTAPTAADIFERLAAWFDTDFNTNNYWMAIVH
jgi:hypothetical protein